MIYIQNIMSRVKKRALLSGLCFYAILENFSFAKILKKHINTPDTAAFSSKKRAIKNRENINNIAKDPLSLIFINCIAS